MCTLAMRRLTPANCLTVRGQLGAARRCRARSPLQMLRRSMLVELQVERLSVSMLVELQVDCLVEVESQAKEETGV